MEKKNSWDTLNPIINVTRESTHSIDWSMEVYNSSEYKLTQSVTPNYSTMEFYKR